MTQNHTKIVATLLAVLGVELSGEILKRMPEPEALKLLRMLKVTEGFSEKDAESAIQYFLTSYKLVSKNQASVQFHPSQWTQALAGVGNTKLKSAWLSSLEENSLTEEIKSTLEAIDPAFLQEWISQERATVIACVLSLTSPLRAAHFFKTLAPEQRTLVLCRLAQLKSVDRPTLEMIRDELSSLKTISAQQRKKIGGLESVVSMLQTLPASERERLLAALGEKSPELAENISSRVVTFELVEKLFPQDVAKVCAELTDKDLALLLKTEKKSVMDACLKQVSKNRRDCITEEASFLANLKPDTVKACQKKAVSVLLRLKEKGHIVFPWEESMVG